MTSPDKRTRLSPPLMHVFRAAHAAKDAKKRVDIRDEAGERVLAGRRLRARQVITESVLRREVARDLDALLNTIAMESTIDMSETPEARKSILNFGIPGSDQPHHRRNRRRRYSRGNPNRDHQF